MFDIVDNACTLENIKRVIRYSLICRWIRSLLSRVKIKCNVSSNPELYTNNFNEVMEIASEDKFCVVVKQVWTESLSNSRNVWVKDFKHKENNENVSVSRSSFSTKIL